MPENRDAKSIEGEGYVEEVPLQSTRWSRRAYDGHKRVLEHFRARKNTSDSDKLDTFDIFAAHLFRHIITHYHT